MRMPALQLDMVLSAPNASEWLATHLAERFGHRDDNGLTGPAQVVSISDLVTDHAAPVRAHHARLVAAGMPGAAAATYLTDWFAGAVAGAVGYALATAGAGFLLAEMDGCDDIRFHLHPDGWPLGVELPARAAVLPDHPWADAEDSEVLATAHGVVERTVQQLVLSVSPLIEACHHTARIGAVGLWNEVADNLGKALAFQHRLDPTPAMVALLDAAVRMPDTPWKACPRLAFVDSERLGSVHVAQKGGCCLAYTVPHDPASIAEEDDGTPHQRAYLLRFPPDPDQPRYCSTCSFREPADSEARQLFWHEHHA